MNRHPLPRGRKRLGSLNKAIFSSPRYGERTKSGLSLCLALAMLVALGLFSGAGCSNSLLNPGPPPELYVLTPKTTYPKDLPRVESQLVVSLPTASRALDTDHIALKPIPEQFKYFSGARWSGRAPEMVQTLLVESLESTDRIVAVGKEALTLRPDYGLITELREFQAEYYASAENAPKVRVRLNAKLIRQPEGRIIGSEEFEYICQAEGPNLVSVVRAFDYALGKVLKRCVIWSLKAMAQDEARGE